MRQDETEITGLYRRHYERIYRYCVYRLYSRDVAEDAAAEVFLRLVEEYDRVKVRDAEGIRNWLYGTASNVAAKYLRDARRRREIAEAVNRRANRSEEGAGDDDRADWTSLYEAIGRLGGKDQELITLRYLEGLATQEIAELLGMRHVTVRVRLSRAVGKLKRELGVDDD